MPAFLSLACCRRSVPHGCPLGSFAFLFWIFFFLFNGVAASIHRVLMCSEFLVCSVVRFVAAVVLFANWSAGVCFPCLSPVSVFVWFVRFSFLEECAHGAAPC